MSTIVATNLKHNASASNNIVLDSSGNAVVAGTLRSGGLSTDIYPLVADTAKASTSGPTVEFTGIPSWARQITVMFDGVSTNGSSNLLVQIGTSSGFEITNYRGTAFYPGASYGQMSAGFLVSPANAAANVWNGSMILSLLGSNTWTEQGIVTLSSAQALGISSGAKTLGGTLDRVRVTTVNGTDTFDAGSINIFYV